jgi:TatD DNase family protein
MNLVDSHCHLDDAQFEADREQVVNRARAAGVEYMLAIGTGDGPPDLEAAIRLAETYPFIFATAGVHPNDAPKASPQTLLQLQKLLRHPRLKALGEIGLDQHWGIPLEQQMPVFIDQLALAAEARLPVIIHTRDAWQATLDILRKHWAPTGLPCIMHCFTGNAEQARECLDLGFYLAFGGIVTFPKAEAVREAARLTPSDRLLLETDSPYLAPVPYRGKRNEPAYILETARVLSKVRNVSLEQLACETKTNFERIFKISRI